MLKELEELRITIKTGQLLIESEEDIEKLTNKVLEITKEILKELKNEIFIEVDVGIKLREQF